MYSSAFILRRRQFLDRRRFCFQIISVIVHAVGAKQFMPDSAMFPCWMDPVCREESLLNPVSITPLHCDREGYVGYLSRCSIHHTRRRLHGCVTHSACGIFGQPVRSINHDYPKILKKSLQLPGERKVANGNSAFSFAWYGLFYRIRAELQIARHWRTNIRLKQYIPMQANTLSCSGHSAV